MATTLNEELNKLGLQMNQVIDEGCKYACKYWQEAWENSVTDLNGVDGAELRQLEGVDLCKSIAERQELTGERFQELFKLHCEECPFDKLWFNT